jgi:hypothetical protein
MKTDNFVSILLNTDLLTPISQVRMMNTTVEQRILKRAQDEGKSNGMTFTPSIKNIGKLLSIILMIFRIIMTMSIKLAVCWDAAPWGLVQTDRGLRHHHHTTRHTIPEDNHLCNINVCSSNNAGAGVAQAV